MHYHRQIYYTKKHINKQARKSSSQFFHLLMLNIPCFIRDWFGYGQLQVFRHIRASYFRFNTFLMNVDVIALK